MMEMNVILFTSFTQKPLTVRGKVTLKNVIIYINFVSVEILVVQFC